MSQLTATLPRRNGTLPWSSDTTETTETFAGLASKSYHNKNRAVQCSGAEGHRQDAHVRCRCRRLRTQNRRLTPR